MVAVEDLHLAFEGNMVDTSPECLERLKTALNGGYALFSNDGRFMIFEVRA